MQLAPHLAQLLPPWLYALYDPAREVAAAAEASLQTAFPSKRSAAVAFCRDSILQNVLSCLKQTPQTLGTFA